MTHVYSYTTRDNARSEAVMRRIGLRRLPERDFSQDNGDRYIVYIARRGLPSA